MPFILSVKLFIDHNFYAAILLCSFMLGWRCRCYPNLKNGLLCDLRVPAQYKIFNCILCDVDLSSAIHRNSVCRCCFFISFFFFAFFVMFCVEGLQNGRSHTERTQRPYSVHRAGLPIKKKLFEFCALNRIAQW